MIDLRRIGVAAVALGAVGCMTLDTLTDSGYRGPLTYSGVRVNANNIDKAGFNQLFILMSVLDIPLCLVADTLALPFTIPADRRRRRDETGLGDRDVPSPYLGEGGDPVAEARRLFRFCADLLIHRDPELADCYAVDARVRLTGVAPGAEPRELRGVEYKQVILAALAALDRDAYVDVRDPTFEVEGPRVRIDATWIASFSDVRHPISWLVGPGIDGYWRIMEAVGPGWPATADE